VTAAELVVTNRRRPKMRIGRHQTRATVRCEASVAETGRPQQGICFLGPSPLAAVVDVRNTDIMTQGSLPILEFATTCASGGITVRPLAGVTVRFAAVAYKLVST
jgi:hypothetical protein